MSAMNHSSVTRREALRAAALLSTTALLSHSDALAAPANAAPRAGKTPALSPADQAAIDAALGKKGTYNEAQATHLVG